MVGCGQHIDSALAGLTQDQICQCKGVQRNNNNNTVQILIVMCILYYMYYYFYSSTTYAVEAPKAH